MKWLLFLFIFISINGSFAQSLNYEVKTLDNQWVNLETLTGNHYTVIDFWATWCKPCVNALPKINELAEKYKVSGVNVIGVNVDGPRNQAKIKPFTRSLNIGYAVILDPDQEMMTDLNISVLPTLIILNSNNIEVYRHEGFQQGDEHILDQKLQELLQ